MPSGGEFAPGGTRNDRSAFLRERRRPGSPLLMVSLLSSVSLLLAGCERSLIYYPAKASEARLTALARSQGLSPWRNAQGERIGWVARANAGSEARPTVVVFHGNAGSAVDRGYFAAGIRTATGPTPWEVYLFEYPGYGSRSGSPSESAIIAAASAALAELDARRTGPLFLAGESLGGGVACALAAMYPDIIDGVLLVTPFTSLADVARAHYPGVLVRLLLRERYDNLAALAGYRGPVAILLAGRDEVVPAELGRRLYDAYAGPKRLWVQEERGHNTLALEPSQPWWRDVTRFLLEPPSSAP